MPRFHADLSVENPERDVSKTQNVGPPTRNPSSGASTLVTIQTHTMRAARMHIGGK
jgi:hypothetical protein